MFNDVIYLVTKKSTTNEVGDQIETEQKEQRFAKVKSIGFSEFYQAQSQGMKPEVKFILADHLDYDNQDEVIFRNFRYKVLRTFKPEDKNEIEIVCYGGVRMEVATDGNS